MRLYQKDITSKKVILYMVDDSDHVTPETGLTLTVRVSKNGGAFAAGAGSVAELEDGLYAYTLGAGDVNTLGPVVVKATATGADQCVVEGRVVAFDPDDAIGLGLSRLDATVTSRLAAANVPENFKDLSITATTGKVTVDNVDDCKADVSNVTVGTNLDKTGYALTTSERSSIATAVWSATTRTLSSFGSLVADMAAGVWGAMTRTLTAGTRDTEIDTIVGKLPAGGIAAQSTLNGLSYDFNLHRGAYTTARAAKLDNLDATVTSRLAAASYTQPPTTADIANAIKSSTGWTAGNTMTLEQIVKILAAWSAGRWRDKEGVPGTYQILDPDDGTTVICEVTPSESTPQKTVTVL